ncbi:hypothetical protein SAMN04489860_0768 [Paraoerskovia marina]|uniref:Uncharacterized protein n=1 Tax=Paraoerskovia marina TaxID=545619 RepID=A0A1H1PCN0_9CELL|nr:hypothetical protein [Paraoerskovia marina]SDS08840.1 hypothetical protein SAMN04489860_0768 [Paraoerskovia marina]
MQRRTVPVWVPVLVVVLTVGQLAVAEWWPGIERFADKAFGARLVAYPVMMLLAPALWWLVVRRRDSSARPPWGAFTLIMLPFLIDVTGNSFNLYDTIVWWDDANHFFNWLLLLSGIGLLIGQRIRPHWAQVLMITGAGAILAICWELGEWYTFIRHGTELDVAYQDTLGDLTLGTLGALCAGLIVMALSRRNEVAQDDRRTAASTDAPRRGL